jgi:hypothetical protein
MRQLFLQDDDNFAALEYRSNLLEGGAGADVSPGR